MYLFGEVCICAFRSFAAGVTHAPAPLRSAKRERDRTLRFATGRSVLIESPFWRVLCRGQCCDWRRRGCSLTDLRFASVVILAAGGAGYQIIRMESDLSMYSILYNVYFNVYEPIYVVYLCGTHTYIYKLLYSMDLSYVLYTIEYTI